MLSAVANRIIAQQVGGSGARRARGATDRALPEAHRAHERLVELVTVGAAQEAEACGAVTSKAGWPTWPAAAPPATVLDVMS